MDTVSELYVGEHTIPSQQTQRKTRRNQMTKKYEITDITHPKAPRLRRIRALRDIPTVGVKAGDRGGWVECEHNLSHDGDAWVHDEARVSDSARVSGRAQVFDRARVSDRALVSDRARVFDSAWVSGKAWVYGSALVDGSAIVQSSEDIIHTHVLASDRCGATLHRTTDGHLLKVECWRGTVSEFRTMIESDKWVEATPEQIELRRPELLAFTAMCEARIATWEQP